MTFNPDEGTLTRQQEINSRLTTLVNQTNAIIVDCVSDVLQDFDLTPTQYATLLMLGCNPGSSSARLARLVNVTPQSMGVMVTKLEERGLVQREPAEIHLRVLTITLTSQGLELMEAADLAARGIEERILGSLTPEEGEQLRALLRKVNNFLRA
jgi:DNA-binding MarR family transcriptional regulator